MNRHETSSFWSVICSFRRDVRGRKFDKIGIFRSFPRPKNKLLMDAVAHRHYTQAAEYRHSIIRPRFRSKIYCHRQYMLSTERILAEHIRDRIHTQSTTSEWSTTCGHMPSQVTSINNLSDTARNDEKSKFDWVYRADPYRLVRLVTLPHDRNRSLHMVNERRVHS